MIKGVFGKVVGVGRATVLLVGMAVVFALVFGMASTALGANNDNFILGVLNNGATAVTKLTGNVSGGPALQVSNPNTAAGSRGLQITVAEGKPPIQVNATAGKAANLNADKLDGQEASSFLGVSQKAADADTLDGRDSTAFLEANSKAADSDKLDGQDSTAFRVSCPSGTQLFVGLCFETLARPEANFENATATCAAAGRRLPTSAEANAWARQPGTPLQPGSWNAEWTGDILNLSPSPTSLIVWIPVNQTTPVFSEILQSYNGHRFRCVIPPSN